MSLDFSSDLRCLVMLDGKVFGNIDQSATTRAMEIRLGDALAPFETCTQGPSPLLKHTSTFRLDTRNIVQNSSSLPAENIPGEVYACWVDHLTDWSLNGSQTVQVMINRFEAPCQIFFDNKISVPEVKAGMVFKARLAAHRAAASLCLILRDPVSLQEERHFLPFDTARAGGTSPDGYADMRHPIPQHFQCCDVMFEIEYRKHLPDEKGTEPFLFLADMHVASADTQDYEKLLLEPEWIYGPKEVPDGQWISANLPNMLAPGQGLSIQMGQDVFPITPMSETDFSVRENYGHTLVCHSAQPLELVLSIDGQSVQAISLTPGDNVIRLPAKYLNGHVRHLALKDKSGSVVLFEDQQLLPCILTPEDVMRRESAAPFPDALLPPTPYRYAALKSLMAKAGPTTDFAQLMHALETLEGGHENVIRKPLLFPKVTHPDVSVIIPAHNNIDLTYLALCSLLVGQNTATFEVILVDDASEDETARIEEFVTGITVVRHPVAQRFIRACNAGADRARGKYIALLNNDVEVTAGWLDELLAAFDRFENVGLVGSKLLYPNGDLQDAGGVIWGNGNPWNYGNRQNANDPRFNYARQVDYLSGAAMLVPAAVWKEINGLSTYLEPMYFEDTDFAFKVRAAGYSTWYVPSSVVYHFEGMTSGTDVSTGFKKYQEVNRPKFKRRWANSFANHGAEGQSPDLEKDRGIAGRVLFIDYAPPRFDKDAGSYAALQEMRLVQSLGYKVTFVSTNMAHLGRYTEDLQKSGVEVIYAPFYMNTAEYLDQHATDFDAFYITRYYVAQAVLEQIRRLAPSARILFNNADLHFLRELRAARTEGDADKLQRAFQTRTEEIDVIRNVDVVLSYNEIEHSVIQAYTDGQSTVVKCPWVVNVPNAVPAARARKGLSFLGSFRHHPNTEGIHWFVRNVMPRLVTHDPTVHFNIYGSGMGDDINALQSDNVLPHGFIKDAADAYDTHRIFVAPLLSGAGIKGKVLGALAHGIPCVISPIAAEGIGLRSGYDCIIAERPDAWVDAIQQLDNDDILWEALSQNARSYMHNSYSFERGRQHMRTAFEAADLFAARG
ncbi:glycosyltransferase [Sulfitobacter sp. M57]|nr:MULTISPECIES: glycosyltransferase [unclassified Sulfitobacter]MDF3478576.1 glycosyltransferase [Sulfitobacter sp. M53]MDF3486371.1 glycosyltransferase [Sulfitobacter sp. Ks13]MDF3509786.1 glycosyltransferase [Sulfitobacter sp. M57]MDF3463129.1 glycosyltransferase [Sulfitobacter sp. Ks18]MDF3467029.1 glycosyltransferase [Sulfitobacter sp. M05]